MKKTKIKFYNKYIYSETLSNGLEIIIMPNKTINDIYVTFTSKYGGCNYSFKLNNKLIEVPNGIAHFLEHKMFEQKSGPDPFTFFNKTGSYSNAFTNYYNTSYVYAGNKEFKENINYLLDFVQSPYFTNKNVEKEKGIICEEIKMYDDIPDTVMYEKALFNIFKCHPAKYPISGSVSDVNKITKEDLYNCYNAFYNPKNMFIVITGNIDPKEAIDIIKENQSKKEFNNYEVEINEIEEPNEVLKEYEEINMSMGVPTIAYAIKIPINCFNKIESKKRNMYLSTIFNVLFDETSLFYERMKDKDILNMSIDIDSLDTKSHKIFVLFFKTSRYKELIKEIEEELKNIKVTSSDLERKKKVNISNSLYIFDDIANSNKFILNNKILYNKTFTDIYESIVNMNKKELDYIINNLNLENKSILVIK